MNYLKNIQNKIIKKFGENNVAIIPSATVPTLFRVHFKDSEVVVAISVYYSVNEYGDDYLNKNFWFDDIVSRCKPANIDITINELKKCHQDYLKIKPIIEEIIYGRRKNTNK